MRLKKVHPSWYMSILVAFIMTIGVGLFSSTNSVFMTPICDDLGFSRAQYSLHRTLITLVSVLFTPMYSKLLRTIGVRKIFLFSAIAIGALQVGYGISTELWHFYTFAVINGIFTSGMSFLVAGTFINIWFVDSKGLATAIAYCGSGLGGAIFSPICTTLIEHIGWRLTFCCVAGAGLLLLIPAILFLLKDKPEQIGVQAYRQPEEKKKVDKAITSSARREYTATEAKKTALFWVLLVGYLAISLCSYGPYSHIPAFLTDNGYTLVQATSINSFFMAMLTLANFVVGMIFDKFGMRVGSGCVMLALISFPIFALLITFPASPWLFCIALGFVGAGSGLVLNLLISELFGNQDFGAILSTYTMCNTLIGSTSSPMLGAIYDGTGSYFWGWIILLVSGIVAAGSLLVINLMLSKQNKQLAAQ